MYQSTPPFPPGTSSPFSGILLVDKPAGRSSFSLVAEVRRITGQKKIGHAGTLDPFATGLLILLLSREWTARAGEFLHHDKKYETVFRLGFATDTYDREGTRTESSSYVPSREEVEKALTHFQGEIQQVPPMFSAKKKGGVRLYDLARKGIEVEREPVSVHVALQLIEYEYPLLRLQVHCSKGTYVRSLGHDIGKHLGCYAHVDQLRRVQSGRMSVDDALSEGAFSKETIRANLLTLYPLKE